MNYQAPQNSQRVLILVPAHHSTSEDISYTIANTLATDDVIATVNTYSEAPRTIRHFDAVILGGAVYGGTWTEEAKRFVRSHRAVLRIKPVFLFTSAPVADPKYPPADKSVDVHPIVALSHAREHKVFHTLLDTDFYDQFGQHIPQITSVFKKVHPDWDDIMQWAHHIAHELKRSLKLHQPIAHS